jgi:SRSO17 transposase
MAVPSNEPLMFGGPQSHDARDILEAAVAETPEAWQRLPAGDGEKGPRAFDWALAPLWRLQLTREEQSWGHYLLARRSTDDPGQVTYYVAFCPRDRAELPTLARVAGTRWQIESAFGSAKGECGLDQYEVRKWDAWHRHVTLSMLAHAYLTVTRAEHGATEKGAVLPAERTSRAWSA